jgi:hypothetical protein
MMKRFNLLLPALAVCLLVGLLVWHSEAPLPSPTDVVKKVVVSPKPPMAAPVREQATAQGRLTSVASGRLNRPLTGLSDLRLPEAAEVRWLEPVVEPVFEEFRRWAESFVASGLDGEKGVELALQRRQEMLDLIDKNPRRALELAVPESVRRRLPAAVAGGGGGFAGAAGGGSGGFVGAGGDFCHGWLPDLAHDHVARWTGV